MASSAFYQSVTRWLIKTPKTRDAHLRFTRKLSELTKSIEEDQGSEMVRVNFKELNEAWRNVEAKHDT